MLIILAVTTILGVAFSFYISNKAIHDLFPRSVDHLSTVISRDKLRVCLVALIVFGVISFMSGISLIQEVRETTDAGFVFLIKVISGSALVSVVPMLLAAIFWFFLLTLKKSSVR